MIATRLPQSLLIAPPPVPAQPILHSQVLSGRMGETEQVKLTGQPRIRQQLRPAPRQEVHLATPR